MSAQAGAALHVCLLDVFAEELSPTSVAVKGPKKRKKISMRLIVNIISHLLLVYAQMYLDSMINLPIPSVAAFVVKIVAFRDKAFLTASKRTDEGAFPYVDPRVSL